jgi:hypothetical protein
MYSRCPVIVNLKIKVRDHFLINACTPAIFDAQALAHRVKIFVSFLVGM